MSGVKFRYFQQAIFNSIFHIVNALILYTKKILEDLGKQDSDTSGLGIAYYTTNPAPQSKNTSAF